MHRSDSSVENEQHFKAVLDPLIWLALTEAASWRAMEVQRQLAAKSNGGHRRPAIDFLIAAIAEEHDDVVLWAFDNDYTVISALTGQAAEIEVSTGPGH